MTQMDREWVESMAGHEVTDEQAIRFLESFNEWVDRYNFDLDSRDQMV